VESWGLPDGEMACCSQRDMKRTTLPYLTSSTTLPTEMLKVTVAMLKEYDDRDEKENRNQYNVATYRNIMTAYLMGMPAACLPEVNDEIVVPCAPRRPALPLHTQ